MTFCCPRNDPSGIHGGVVAGGSAVVNVAGDAFDGLGFLLLLNELSTETPDEFVDLTRNGLDGTGSGPPERTEGVFCLPSQHFQSVEYVKLPNDLLHSSQSFSFTALMKPDGYFTERRFYERGSVFALGHSILNQLTAEIVLKGIGGHSVTYSVSDSDSLTQYDFHHIACVVDLGNEMTIYVNGEAKDSVDLNETETMPRTGDCRFAQGGGFRGNLQDCRLYHEALSPEWIQAMFENACSDGFYSVGGEEPAF